MTIHFFPKGNRQTASSRQRAYNVAAELSKLGVATQVHEPFVKMFKKASLTAKIRSVFKIFKVLSSVKRADIIFVQRAVYSTYFLILLVPYKLLFRRKLVFDMDDAIFIHFPFRTKLITRLADVVIVGSHQLKEWALKYNKSVHLIPTAIDYQRYSTYSSDYKDQRPVSIGWIGDGPAHFENLQLLVPIFQECVKRNHNLKLVIVGSLGSDKLKALFNTIPGIDVEYIDSLDWSEYDVVPKTIQTFDIGVMPLTNSFWNKGKCAFKAIEYMACGVPVVISDVGENKYLVEDGKNGFSAQNTEEWVKKMEQLIYSRDLRKKLGKKGQDTIRDTYSYHVTVPKMKYLLN